MKIVLFFASALSSLLAGTIAFADDDDCYAPLSQWQSRDVVIGITQSQGWDVHRIKIDDGCYKILAYDQSGREIEMKIDPSTLAIVEFEYENDGEEEDEHDEHSEYKTHMILRFKLPAELTTPVTPPDNGLFSTNE